MHANAPVDFTPKSKNLSDMMVDYWGNFATTKNPNGNGRVNWTTFSNGVMNLSSGTTLAMKSADKTGGRTHNCDLWDSVIGYPVPQ